MTNAPDTATTMTRRALRDGMRLVHYWNWVIANDPTWATHHLHKEGLGEADIAHARA